MVTYRYLSDKFLKPRPEKPQEPQDGSRELRRNENWTEDWRSGWKNGWTEGWKEGWKESREEERRMWAAWNQRRLEAERNGEPFDEPPPGSEEIR